MNERIGFGQRLAAALIDWTVIIIVGAVIGSMVGGVLGAGVGAAAAAGVQSNDAAATAAVGGILGVIFGALLGMSLVSLVWIVWEGLTGQALGKKLMKIRIKAADGSDAGVGTLLARAAVKYSHSLLNLLALLTGIAILSKLGSLAGLVIFVGCFFVLGANRQAIHDMLAKTAVYKA